MYDVLCRALAQAAQRAGCTGKVTLHRLRHTYATEMVRLGVSLPALMQMLGHKDINMTLRYVEVVQLDLQREFHRARQNNAAVHSIPQLPLLLQPILPTPTCPPSAKPLPRFAIYCSYFMFSLSILAAVVKFDDLHSAFLTLAANSII